MIYIISRSIRFVKRKSKLVALAIQLAVEKNGADSNKSCFHQKSRKFFIFPKICLTVAIYFDIIL